MTETFEPTETAPVAGEPTEATPAAPRRRRGRPPKSAAAGAEAPRRRRRRLSGDELVQELNAMVDQLIRENRQLKRQIDKLQRGTAGGGAAGVRVLRSLQRRLSRVVGSVSAPRRRRATAGTTRRRRSSSRS